MVQIPSSIRPYTALHTPHSGVWDTPHSGLCPYTAVLFIRGVLFAFRLLSLPRSVPNMFSYVILVFWTWFRVRSISFRLVICRIVTSPHYVTLRVFLVHKNYPRLVQPLVRISLLLDIILTYSNVSCSSLIVFGRFM